MAVDVAIARPELLQVADAVAREKMIERDEVLEAMEQAIQKAGRAKYGHEKDIRAFIDRKDGRVKLERWTEVVSGILQYAGVEGFLSNSEKLFEQSDIERSDWETFLEAVEDAFQGAAFTIAEFWERLNEKSYEELIRQSVLTDRAEELRNALPTDLTRWMDREGQFKQRLGVAFKEWAAVCRALADGTQTVILRKGGIAEAGGEFRPEHARFWLYPTHFHEQQRAGLKPEYLPLIDAVQNGRFGQVVHATFRRRCAAPPWSPWMADKTKSGGGVFDLLIHDIDMALVLFGHPDAVSAWGHEDLPGGIDVVTAQLHYPGIANVTITGGWHHKKSYPFSMEYTVVGEGGAIDYSSEGRPPKWYAPDGTASEITLPEKDGYQAEIEYFIECCRANKQPDRCTPESSAAAVKLAVIAAEARNRKGEPVPCQI